MSRRFTATPESVLLWLRSCVVPSRSFLPDGAPRSSAGISAAHERVREEPAGHVGLLFDRDEKLAEQIAYAPRRFGGMCARRWPSGIRNSPPTFRKRSSSCTGPRYGGRVPTIFLDRNVVYHSTVECPDYPQPPEAWWAWPHYQRAYESKARTTCRVRAAIRMARPKARLTREASKPLRPFRNLPARVTAAETSPLANRVLRTACRDVAMTGATHACRFHGGSRGSEPNQDVRGLG
jgi:hypothetical protein